MIELTQKILSLDAEVATELKEADKASLHVIKKADLNARHITEKEQYLFEMKKERDTLSLQESLTLQRQEALVTLEQKMRAYDSSFAVDASVEQLLSAAKERVCP